jgi:uncharacterized protein YndB with AHSA1/START domain
VIDEHGDVVHDVRFPQTIERVWDAISDRGALAQWLMDNDFEPVVGHRFHFDAGPPRGLIDAEVLAVEPPTRLQMRWMLDGRTTTVTIRLHADGDGTRLRLEHTGLSDEQRPKFDTGWVEKFENLTPVLEESR